MLDTIVVGAGQAGLAAGYYLRRAGLSFTILEAGPQPAGSWPHYYQSLRLFSPARYSSLPGRPFPGDPDHYPTRDEVVAYLGDYAAHFDLPVITGASVEEVRQSQGEFQAITSSQAYYRSRTLIATSGLFGRPYLPRLPGQATYRGRVLHSAAYRSPDTFARQRVVVAGAGNSAVQIAVELARVAHVTLATRGPVKWTPQRPLGRDIHFWARLIGIERLPLGRFMRIKELNPVLDTGVYRAAIQSRKPDQRPMFRSFTPEGVIWADGAVEAVDAVIFATGYRPNLEYLRNLQALTPEGHAQQRGGVSLTMPGLCYIGLPAQRTLASATLRGVGPDAAYVVRHIKRVLSSEF
jgi:putative flavoprotein involved in K+ transport